MEVIVISSDSDEDVQVKKTADIKPSKDSLDQSITGNPVGNGKNGDYHSLQNGTKSVFHSESGSFKDSTNSFTDNSKKHSGNTLQNGTIKNKVTLKNNPAKRVLNHNISSNSCCSSKVSCVPNGDNIPNRPSESALPGYVNLGNKSDSSTNNPGTINKDMSAESSFTKDSTKSIAYTSSTSKYSFVMNKKDVSLGSSVTKDSAAHLVNISNTTGVSALTNQGITPESSLTRVCTKSLATAILAGVKKDSTLPGTSLTKDLTENTINTSSTSGVTNQLITPESSKDKVCTKSIATGTLTVVKNDSISADRSVIKDLDGTRTVRNDTDFDSPTGDINFERFLSLCAHLTGIPRVSEFARRCYFKANSVFTDSDHFKNLIRNSISEFQSGKNNDSTRLMESVMSALKENKSKKRKTLQAVCDNPEKVRRVQVSTVDCLPSTSKMTEKVANGGGSPPQSEPEDTGAQQTNERVKKKPGRKYTPEEIEVKKKKMVGYLKKLEKAIKSCHQADLGIEDMDMADSAYINEDRLTKKYMEAYARYCKLENCSEKLGRPTEKSISITTSRFDEINKLVQSHVNKRRKFPDYPQVFFLVKKASKDNNLNLRKTELESIAKEMFEFIGKTKKKRRLEDLSLILGLDSNENSEDPAKKDPELRKQLGENSKLGKERLDAEFQKFTDRGKTEQRATATTTITEAKQNGNDVADDEEEGGDVLNETSEEEEDEEDEEEEEEEIP